MNDKIITNGMEILQLVSDNEVKEQVGEAFASLMLNPLVSWAKFILTDDKPNGNGMRVPPEEFDNLIKSGLHMPIKMAEGKIEEDHSNAKPIGVITHLKKEFIDGVNQIVGLAALWLRERPSDVSYLKDTLENGGDINLSWELAYGIREPGDAGTVNLRDVVLQAATIVTRPAYQGRTRIVAMAAKESPKVWSEDYINSLPDSHFLYVESGGEKDSEGRTSPRNLRHFAFRSESGLVTKERLEGVLQEAGKTKLPAPILRSVEKTVTALLERIEAGASVDELTAPLENIETEEVNVEELEQLKQRYAQLEEELNTVKAQLQEKEQALASLDTEKTEMASELETLRAFKDEIESEKAREEKFASIKTKFAEAGLEKEETYFTENKDKLLALDEAALDFMIQELAAFAKNEAEATLNGTKVPNLISNSGEVSIKELAQGLRERAKKAK